jgi:hypothetical protein
MRAYVRLTKIFGLWGTLLLENQSDFPLFANFFVGTFKYHVNQKLKEFVMSSKLSPRSRQ